MAMQPTDTTRPLRDSHGNESNFWMKPIERLWRDDETGAEEWRPETSTKTDGSCC